MGAGPSGSRCFVLGLDTTKGSGACMGQLGGPTAMRNIVVLAIDLQPPPGVVTRSSLADDSKSVDQSSVLQLVLPMEGNLVRTADFADNGSMPICSVQNILDPASASVSKMSHLEPLSQLFSLPPFRNCR